MRTVGLIVEYNPLHNGHSYHYQQSMKVSGAEAAVCIMSGHFLQRGEPALASKWARAEMALAMGADLVLELPAAFAVQPAEWFGYGAVSALEATGVVDTLCFGSESGELGWLDQAAGLLAAEPPQLHEELRLGLKAGLPYPAAYSRAVAALVPGASPEELAKPNNTLGLHYLIALHRLQSGIRPLTIPRTKAEYRQEEITDRRIASATALRKLLFEGGDLTAIAPYVPASTLTILQREYAAGRAPLGWERFARPLLLKLATFGPQGLAACHEVTEGLEHRILRVLSEGLPSAPEGMVSSLLDQLKTKRYTRTKLQRMLLHILLGHSKAALAPEVLRQGVPYLRVLGFGPKGQALLKRMKKTAKVPVLTKVPSENAPPLLELDLRATSAYALGYDHPSSREMFRDYYEAPLRCSEDCPAAPGGSA
ncbi:MULTISPECIES: nucleotidyltransferase [Paenibacillus]|uniref:nucleotidyltransferase n=1 Tax=Paenibacillus TaxID=44249 RepID=UPI0022B8F497|nr:nucleotidyltransferase [Paenibacillus caseinilyticus]MCZ8520102.1 nucleotidyltransferase [Paenibacillus caseinilyticus]